ncbi:MAG: hypothetical protein RL340_1518 [Gemmatimonadota bacterium]|jgi:hypothetical protein
MTPKTRPTPAPDAHPVRDAADALYRAALESCHQHERFARVLKHGLDDLELEGVAQVADLCDRLLATATTRYESTAAAGPGDEDAGWWHAANALWMASREYCRRHAQSDVVGTKLKRHGAAQLGEISVEYELEVSARLALKQAIAGYATHRPDAAA